MASTAIKSVREALGGDTFPLCESPSLRLEKFVRIGGNTKREEIESVITCQRKNGKAIPSLSPKGAILFEAKLESNLIVNQAGGVLENAGLCLHSHFGTPYIPGSAVKGIARHAAWCAWSEEKDPEKKVAIAREIADIFGYPTGDKKGKNDPDTREYLDDFLATHGHKTVTSGTVAFLNATPTGTAQLALDIVNCHHKKYYAGEIEYATDDEAPIPNFFLSVKKGNTFRFTLVPLKNCNSQLERAKEWLLAGITILGIGAKTAAGYGSFSYDADADARRAEFAQKQAEEKARVAAEAKAKEEERAKQVARANRSSDDVCKEIIDRWNKSNVKKILKSGDISGFDKLKDEKAKKGIVLALQMTDGIGAQVWKELKSGQKGDIAKGEQAIRKFCKDNGLGKMP